MADERSFFNEGSVVITNSRAVIGGTTYAMSNITSVGMGSTPASRALGIIIAIFGVLVLLGGAAAESGGVIAFGVVVLAVGIAAAVLPKPTYIVKLGSASGEQRALSSKDREFIERVVNAMNGAIVHRG